MAGKREEQNCDKNEAPKEIILRSLLHHPTIALTC